MTSVVNTNKLRTTIKHEIWDHDPGATSAVITSPDGGTTLRVVDMAVYSGALFSAMTTIPSTGALTLLEIVASAASTMTSPVVVKGSGAVLADAVNDWVALEVSAQEIADEGARAGVNLRYVAARLTMSNAGGEAVVTHILKPVYPAANMTPLTTIS